MLHSITYIAMIALTLYALQRIMYYVLSHRNTKPTASQFEEARIHWVADGDTIDVETDNGIDRIRVIGIDAPETHHPDKSRNCIEGMYATSYARKLMPAGMPIWLEKDTEDKDKYGRLLRHVWLSNPMSTSFADASLACKMVGSGHAVPMYVKPNLKHAIEISRCAYSK